MNIDYSKIVVGDYSKLISEERLSLLKSLALDKKKFLDYQYKYMIGSEKLLVIIDKAFKFAYIDKDNCEKNKYEKTIIVNNIVFDNTRFAKILKIGNFDKDKLQKLIILVNYVKNKKDKNELSKDDIKYIDVINIYMKELVRHFHMYIGQIKPEIIINKLNELLIYEPELLEDKKNNHTR